MTEPTELARIATALEALAARLGTSDATADRPQDLGDADAFVWHADPPRLEPVHRVARVPLDRLSGIDHVLSILKANTEQFAQGFGANNALLWGARGMGKSSLVKAVHADIVARRSEGSPRLLLIEIAREDIASLPTLMRRIAGRPERVIVFCDDLSFDAGETSYKALKSVLDGGLEGRPDNVVFYATSNRRHLMPRDMIENERSSAINPGEAVEEKVSLSDRFGLWLGFHNCDQTTYLAMVNDYARAFGISLPREEIEARAIEWSMTRGARSGRVAVQFARSLAGELGLSA